MGGSNKVKAVIVIRLSNIKFKIGIKKILL